MMPSWLVFPQSGRKQVQQGTLQNNFNEPRTNQEGKQAAPQASHPETEDQEKGCNRRYHFHDSPVPLGQEYVPFAVMALETAGKTHLPMSKLSITVWANRVPRMVCCPNHGSRLYPRLKDSQFADAFSILLATFT